MITLVKIYCTYEKFVPQNVKDMPYDTEIPFLKEMKICAHIKACIEMFIAHYS